MCQFQDRPYLLHIYHRYLQHGDEQVFREEVRRCYDVSTLKRILEISYADDLKPAVMMAIRAIGDSHSVGSAMASLLHHDDPRVCEFAEEILREGRYLDGTPEQQNLLRSLCLANKRGDYRVASEIVEKLHHDAPCIAETWYQQGLMFIGQMATQYAPNVEIDPDIEDILNAKDSLNAEDDLDIEDDLDEQDPWQSALICCRKAVSSNPYHFDAFVSIGMICEGLMDWSGAEQAYKDALKLHPHCKKARQSLDSLPARQKRYC